MVTRRPQEAGPITLWHDAAAVPAGCRAVMAVTRHDLEPLGVSVAATMTDALVLACPPEARDAVRTRLARFDALLHPNGGSAWKEECESLSKKTVGLVAGVNKVLVGREEDGKVRLLRSSDTGLGDHYIDPTGTGARLDDDRLAWPAALEEPYLADVIARGPDAPSRVPPDLPAWVDDRPAMRPARASTIVELRKLRREIGDETIGPHARYVTVGEGPATAYCLGVDRDPSTWQESWPWHKDGAPCRVGICDRGSRQGDVIESHGSGPTVVVGTMRDVFSAWRRELDVTVEGPARGLRHVAPVTSREALIELVCRSGELAGEVAEDEPLGFGHVGVEDLLGDAQALSGAELARVTGLPERTARRCGRFGFAVSLDRRRGGTRWTSSRAPLCPLRTPARRWCPPRCAVLLGRLQEGCTPRPPDRPCRTLPGPGAETLR